MAQLFRPESNRRFRVTILGALVALLALTGFSYYHFNSAAYWNVGEPAPQPIQFPHSLHVDGLGVDCRYCHSSVERAAYAGMPSAQTCLTCHSQILRGVRAMQPLWTSVEFDQPIRWSSVHRLPPYSRFHHGAHVNAGVACETCHGDYSEKALSVKSETLSMGWCLDCHRRTERSRIQAVADHRTDPRLTDCSVCHY